MFKKLSPRVISVTLALTVILMAFTPTVSAQGPSGSWGSNISCTNVGGGAATFSFTFYSADNGTAVASYLDTTLVPQNSSRVYLSSSDFPLSPGFLGSAVLSSDQEAVCNIKTQLINAGLGTPSNPARLDESNGFTSAMASSTLYVPQLEKAFYGWNTYLAVQNTESVAVTATVAYRDRNGNPLPTATEAALIPPLSMHVFYQPNNANLPTGSQGVFSAVIMGTTPTGTGKLAALAAMYNTVTNYTTSQFQTYAAVSSGSNKIYVPRFLRNYYGFNSGMVIQNVGTVSTTVTISYTIGGQLFVQPVPNIAAGSAYFLYAPNVTQLNGADGLGALTRYGSATITTDNPSALVIATVNDDNRGYCTAGVACPPIPPEWVGWGSTYNAIPGGNESTTVVFPGVMRAVLGFFQSGFQVSNVTGLSTTCDITYPDATAANETAVPLGPYGSIARFAPNVLNLPNGYNSTVVVTCLQPVIVGMQNSSARNSSYYGDSETQTAGWNR